MAKFNKICVLDLETTGHTYSRGDRIIQIGLVIIEDGQVTTTFSQLINPKIAIPPRVQKLTGITDEMVEETPTLSQVVDQLMPLLNNAIFVAHQVKFDLLFLQAALADLGIVYEPQGILDTVILSKILAPLAPGFNVGDLSQYFGFEIKQLHNAYEDAYLTSQILQSLAYEFTHLPERMRLALIRLSKHLSYSECLFFEELALSLSQRPPLCVGDESLIPQAVFEDNPQIDKIETLLESHQRVVLQSCPVDFPLHQLIVGRISRGAKIVLIGDEAREEYFKFRRANEFINLDDLQVILKKIPIKQIGEHELTWWMSILVWTCQTKTGLIEELPSEANALQMLNKYDSSTFKEKKSSYYEAHIQALKEARFVLVRSKDLKYFLSLSKRIGLDVTTYQLMIPFLEDFHLDNLRSKEHRLKLSDFFMTLHRFISQDISRYQVSRTFWNRCHDLLQDLEGIINRAGQLLSDLYAHEEVNGESRFMVLNEDDYLTFAHSLSQVDERIRSLKGFHQLFRGSQLKYHFKQFAFWYQKFLEMGNNRSSLSLEGLQIFKKFYQLDLTLLDMTYQEEDAYIWVAWESVLILDDTFSSSYGKFFGLHRLLKDFVKIDYQAKKEEVIKVQVPVYYDGLEEDIDGKSHQLSQHLSGQIKKVVQMIVEEDMMGDKIIILAPNKQAVEALNYALTLPQYQSGHMVLGEKIFGSSRKIERFFKEQDKAIMILNTPYYHLPILPEFEEPVSIIILSLIFDPLGDGLVQRLQAYHEWSDKEVFDYYILPRMQVRMKHLIQKASHKANRDQLYLQDDRIFTKYYSNNFRQFLSPEIIFTIMD